MDNGTVWVRLGARVQLDKPLSEYKDAEDLGIALTEAIRRKAFEVEGDTYVPDPVLDDLADDLGFEWEGGDMELGEL